MTDKTKEINKEEQLKENKKQEANKETTKETNKASKKENRNFKKEIKDLEKALRAATVERQKFVEQIESLKKEIIDIKVAAHSVNEDKNKLHDRLEEEKKEIMKYRAKDFLISILPTIDMFESALSSQNISDELRAWLSGFEMILKNFHNALEAEGVEKIKAEKGVEFDHNLHHAIEQKETNEVEPGHILEVKQPGYTLKGKLLRPASVVVAKTEEAKETEEKEVKKENKESNNKEE